MAANTTQTIPIPDPCSLVRVRDAALIAGLNTETIRRRVRRGEIRAYGRPQRVAVQDLLLPHDPRSVAKSREK